MALALCCTAAFLLGAFLAYALCMWVKYGSNGLASLVMDMGHALMAMLGAGLVAGVAGAAVWAALHGN